MGVLGRAFGVAIVAAFAAVGLKIVFGGGCGLLGARQCVELAVRGMLASVPARATWHSHPYVVLDPLFDDSADADTVLGIATKFATEKGFGLYSNSAQNDGGDFPNVPQRLDAAYNYMITGGPKGRREVYSKARARTNYFRETYAYGDEMHVANAGLLLNHPALAAAAQQVFPDGRCAVVDPYVVYANLMVPGQELAIHTDVPAFRGITRTSSPEWLMVVMLHSGLFDAHRLRIATGVTWYHSPKKGGGSFVYWPDGPHKPSKRHKVAYNTAVVIDTDAVFHGVEPVDKINDTQPVPIIKPGNRLHFVPDEGTWEIRDGDTVLSSYTKPEIRLSVSWKAYCFKSEDEKSKWQDHSDDLTTQEVFDVLIADMRRRGRIGDVTPTGVDLAVLLMMEYIKFPPSQHWGANYCMLSPLHQLMCGANATDLPPDFRKGCDQTAA